jgi:hypothetical protein
LCAPFFLYIAHCVFINYVSGLPFLVSTADCACLSDCGVSNCVYYVDLQYSQILVAFKLKCHFPFINNKYGFR